MTDDNSERGTGRNLAPETLAAQALGRIDEMTRALVPPVHPSTTYERDPDGDYSSGRGYRRPHNPTYDGPEELLAALEGGSDCLLKEQVPEIVAVVDATDHASGTNPYFKTKKGAT